MPLEDEFCDIVKKARNGRGWTVTQLAGSVNVSPGYIEQLEGGTQCPREKDCEQIGNALGIKPSALIAGTVNGWVPQPSPPWVSTVVTTILGEIGGYEVKGYVLHDSIKKEALCIDTAYNAPEMLRVLKEMNLTLKAVCLTHGHTDHAGGLDAILREWDVPVFLGDGDFPLLPWKPPLETITIPMDGENIMVGTFRVTCVATPGHTPGGFCFRVSANDREVCFVGDTLFAGSIGRSNPFSLYEQHLSSVRSRVLALPGETVLLPGHGPATTVSEELINNPFGGN